jgi:transposase-like protein
MARKSQFSSEYKTMLLSRFHESGLSTRAFAEQEGIKQTTLNYWLKKESEFAIAINSKPENKPNLIDVTGQVRMMQQDDVVRLTINGFKVCCSRSDLSSIIAALREND